jgi:tRNA-dihydrouridine synthase A
MTRSDGTSTTFRDKELHIAPMMNVSNHEFRCFMRLLTKRAVLWTAMVTDEVIYYAARDHNQSDKKGLPATEHLYYDRSVEPPIVCQIGGTQPPMTAVAAQVVQAYGYDQVNLNMGCPSNRVSGRQCGAILMKQSSRAVELVTTVKENVSTLPVSVKCRVGVDDCDDFDFLADWIQQLQEAGCRKFILHARKCLLRGLSPSQNRSVPPLNYPIVYSLCERFPECDFWINGGITSLPAAKALVIDGVRNMHPSTHVHHAVPCVLCQAPNGSCTVPPLAPPPNLRGCMLGRASMDQPALFWDVDRYFYGSATNPSQTRRQVLDQYKARLQQLYPRRCCDEDERKTIRLPAPQVTHTRPHCVLCGNGEERSTKEHYSGGGETVTARPPLVVVAKAKITHSIMERSLKPVRNLFYNLPGHAAFRRACDDLGHNMTIRNCGPAFALQQALLVVPAENLDRAFEPTQEDLVS